MVEVHASKKSFHLRHFHRINSPNIELIFGCLSFYCYPVLVYSYSFKHINIIACADAQRHRNPSLGLVHRCLVFGCTQQNKASNVHLTVFEREGENLVNPLVFASNELHQIHWRSFSPSSTMIGWVRIGCLDPVCRRPSARLGIPSRTRASTIQPMTRGRCGWLVLHRKGLSPSTPPRSPGARDSYFFGSFRGRPRGRKVAPRPRRAAVARTHLGPPKGVPRLTLLRSTASSSGSSPRST